MRKETGNQAKYKDFPRGLRNTKLAESRAEFYVRKSSFQIRGVSYQFLLSCFLMKGTPQEAKRTSCVTSSYRVKLSQVHYALHQFYLLSSKGK